MGRPRNYPYGATIRSRHLTFSAGAACLDYANTRELRKGPEPQEFLHGYDDLLAFARRVKLLSTAEVRLLGDSASARPRKARLVFEEAVRLREAIHAVVVACASGSAPPTSAMNRINEHRRVATRRSQIAFVSGRFERRWLVRSGDLDAVAWPIAESIAILLVDEVRMSLLRECRGVDCGWLFLDHSRTRRRRWCDMRACGNRAKAARHYARRRDSAHL